jgi:hypothetical protein
MDGRLHHRVAVAGVEDLDVGTDLPNARLGAGPVGLFKVGDAVEADLRGLVWPSRCGRIRGRESSPEGLTRGDRGCPLAVVVGIDVDTNDPCRQPERDVVTAALGDPGVDLLCGRVATLPARKSGRRRTFAPDRDWSFPTGVTVPVRGLSVGPVSAVLRSVTTTVPCGSSGSATRRST